MDSVPVTDIAASVSQDSVAFLIASGAVRLSNGTVVIADGYASTIRFFDSAGRPITKYGRGGDGPGEFGLIRWLGRCGGDTLFIFDARSRMTVLGADGSLKRQFAVPADTVGGPQPVFFACGSGPQLAFVAPNWSTESADMRSSEYSTGIAGLMDREGHIERIVDSVKVGQMRPFPRYTHLSVSDSRFFVGPQDTNRVLAYGLQDAEPDTISIGVAGRPVTNHEYEVAIEQQAEVVGSRAERENVMRLMRRIPKPETLAPYFALFAVGHDTLWAQISAPGDSVTVLDAVGPDGSPAGEARIPQDLTVMDMGRNYILGVYQTAEGDQHVAVYQLHPPGGG